MTDKFTNNVLLQNIEQDIRKYQLYNADKHLDDDLKQAAVKEPCLTAAEKTSFTQSQTNLEKIPNSLKQQIESFGDDFLEICITFTDHNRLNFFESTLKNMVIQSFQQAIINCRCYPQYMLFSEYSKVGNFHYHGMLKGFNGSTLAKLKRILNHTCGRTIINQVKYTENYKNYIVKDFYQNNTRYDIKFMYKTV